jgi:predicted tellurium resistance membrane protein TerC
MDFITFPDLIALVTLTFLEIVLGIDNIIFISIATDKLPKANQKSARLIGLGLALLMRIILLSLITQLQALNNTLFEVFDIDITGKGLILLGGGLFLLIKSTLEIHHKVEQIEHTSETSKKSVTMGSAITQIILLDLVFSFDSILTAVGLSNNLSIMVIAVVISMIIMMVFANSISDFINRHPSLQLLALSFLILIGFMLVLEAFHFEIPKGYIYFAVLFSFIIELLNMRFRANKKAKLSKEKES